jgi:hypothetical protein
VGGDLDVGMHGYHLEPDDFVIRSGGLFVVDCPVCYFLSHVWRRQRQVQDRGPLSVPVVVRGCVWDVYQSPVLFFNQCGELLGSSWCVHLAVPQGVVGIKVSRDDAPAGEGEVGEGARDSVEVRRSVMFVVYVNEEKGGYEVGAYLQYLEIRVFA